MEQKPIYSSIFTNNIWSYLLSSSVITGPPPTRTKTITNVSHDTPTHQPSHPPTDHTTDHALQRYSSTYSSKQMRWFVLKLCQSRPVYHSEETKYCTNQGNMATSHWHENTPPIEKRPRPTHPTTQPPTNHPNHTMCCNSSTAVHTARNRCV